MPAGLLNSSSSPLTVAKHTGWVRRFWVLALLIPSNYVPTQAKKKKKKERKENHDSSVLGSMHHISPPPNHQKWCAKRKKPDWNMHTLCTRYFSLRLWGGGSDGRVATGKESQKSA